MTTLTQNNFIIGSKVFCREGQCGKLAKIVIDPKTLQVRSLIVEEGMLLKQARVFPVDRVDMSIEDEIYLTINKDELAQFPEFIETKYEMPDPGWAGFNVYQTGDVVFSDVDMVGVESTIPSGEPIRIGISPELEVLAKGTEIRNTQGVVGKLDNVVSDSSSHTVTHLVIRKGFLFPEQVRIPISMVKEVGDDSIILLATNEELERYFEDIQNGFDDRGDGQPMNDKSLSQEMDVVSEISNWLAEDPRTSDEVIEVVNDRGMITLSGEVNDLQAKGAAEEIANSHPKVISVVNTIQVF